MYKSFVKQFVIKKQQQQQQNICIDTLNNKNN